MIDKITASLEIISHLSRYCKHKAVDNSKRAQNVTKRNLLSRNVPRSAKAIGPLQS